MSKQPSYEAETAHEIRNVIHAIAAYAQICDERDLSLGAKESFEKITSCSKYLLDLVNEILDREKGQGDIKIRENVFSLRKFLEEIRDIVLVQCKKKMIVYEERIDEDVCDVCFADERKLKQILINLLDNAIKFTEEGGRISLFVERRGDLSVFHVEDNGVGMKEEFLKHVFEPFEREGKKDGSGLGLYLCKEYVEKMGGRILVCSKKEKGSVFSVEVPLFKEEKERFSFEQRRFLIAEDVKINAQILEKLLHAFKGKTDWARDGKEALEKYCQNPQGYYDLILMDVFMPVLDGMEVTRRIRREDRKDNNIIIIAISGDESNRGVCFEAGMNDFLSKPFDKDELYRLISKYIGDKRAQLT